MLRRVLIKPLNDQAANELRCLKNLRVAVTNSKPPYVNACLFTSLMILLFCLLSFSCIFLGVLEEKGSHPRVSLGRTGV